MYVTPPADVLSGASPDAVLVGGAYVAASRGVFILQIPLIGLCLLGCAFIRDRGLQPLEDKTEGGSGFNNNGTKKVKEFNMSVDELQQSQPQQQPPPKSEEEKRGTLIDGKSKE